jgi:hypothetical protein
MCIFDSLWTNLIHWLYRISLVTATHCSNVVIVGCIDFFHVLFEVNIHFSLVLCLALFLLRLVFLFDFIGRFLRCRGGIDCVINWSKQIILVVFKLHQGEVKQSLTLTSSLIRNNRCKSALFSFLFTFQWKFLFSLELLLRFLKFCFIPESVVLRVELQFSFQCLRF